MKTAPTTASGAAALLGRRVHVILARRLAVAALLVSLLFGAGMFFYEMEKVDDSTVKLALQESKLFERQAGFLLNRPERIEREKLQAELDAFMRARILAGDGHFVFMEFYSTNQEMVAESANDTFTRDLEHRIDVSVHQFYPDHVWYQRVITDGAIYIQTVTPVQNSDGNLVGYFEGVYHVAADTVAEIRDRVVTTIATVVMVVMATTLFLYPIILSLNRGLMRLSRDLLRANLETLAVLGGAIAKRDSDTNAHNFRVTVYAIRLAEAIGMSRAGILGLIKGAFLHDVGKIAISDAILLKPGRLTEDEFAIMRTHVQHGVDIVRRSDWLAGAAEVVRCHHEKFDGSGYLEGLVGEAIPLSARVFAVVDVFDALTSRRPYKEPMSYEDTMAILAKGSGSHFDPKLVSAFAKIAPALYEEFSGREDERAEMALHALTAQYFKTV
ncbi:MAG: HD-GYP domain-containing protein [Alphaproteobacteria bacterium]